MDLLHANAVKNIRRFGIRNDLDANCLEHNKPFISKNLETAQYIENLEYLKFHKDLTHQNYFEKLWGLFTKYISALIPNHTLLFAKYSRALDGSKAKDDKIKELKARLEDARLSYSDLYKAQSIKSTEELDIIEKVDILVKLKKQCDHVKSVRCKIKNIDDQIEILHNTTSEVTDLECQSMFELELLQAEINKQRTEELRIQNIAKDESLRLKKKKDRQAQRALETAQREAEALKKEEEEDAVVQNEKRLKRNKLARERAAEKRENPTHPKHFSEMLNELRKARNLKANLQNKARLDVVTVDSD